MTVFERVVNVLVDAKDCDADAVKMESTWKELELDSLDTVELVMNLEDEFEIELEMDESFKTVGDVVKAIEEKLA
ncbi:MAG TPA: acyl carrier protein [Candidatus Eubacterium pullicola]|uniref:Acyl carrier protein n=1 Tax=Gallibacter intestinalis TaxID=2779356 RepID=A0ABR9QWQ3_9FIRM|nr:acyl carrier protein [Gallibacter intestinalis]MBE5035314.1 acyl carrier protein [Gallibacter intestinalis]HIW39554.1 acyl carrier protein [Candidatus Eubacterium pullicola]